MKNGFLKSGFGVLLLVGLLQSQAMALGLGEIQLKSALNQPFNATIQLTRTAGLTEDEIIVKLASKKDFEQVGVDRLFFLTELKFEVYIESDSSGVIHVTTRNPVDEPYLDFIIETQWPTGRLLREYTVLLDPPVFIESAAAPIDAPVVRSTSVPAVEQVADSATSPSVAGVTSAADPWPQSVSVSEDGFVRTTDETLWEIALKVRPGSEYSIQQTMLAIQDQNPRAFMRGNINLIKQHQKIKVPTPEQIRMRSLAQAEQDVAYQNKMFAEGRRLPSKPQAQPMVAATSSNNQTQKASAEDQAELKLVSASGTATDQTAGGVAGAEDKESPDSLKNALAVSEENLDKSEQEKLDLSNRMAELEKQLETMQKLLALKDEQMALLQAEVDKTGDAEPIVEPTLVSEELETSEQSVDSELEAVSEDTAALEPEPEVVDPEVIKETVSEVIPATVEAAEPPIESDRAREDGLFGLIKDNVYIWLFAAVFAVLVLVLIFKKKAEIDSEDNPFESDIDDLEIPLTDSDFNQEGLEDISGFEEAEELSEEFSTEDLASELSNAQEAQAETKAETSDVLAEADIYLAYGRSQPAIDILSSAIREEPARADLRIKLLEIYADQNDSEAFDLGLAQLAELNDADANQQAAELRTRMVVDDEVAGEVDDLVLDFYQEDESDSVDQVQEVEEVQNSLTGVEAELDTNDIDFDFGETISKDEESSTEDNLDLPDLDFGSTESDPVVSSLEKSIAEHESKDEEDIGDIDFDFDLDSSDELLSGLDADSDSELPVGQEDEEDADLDSINMQMRAEAEAIVARIQEQDVIAPEGDTTDGDDLDSLHMKIQENVAAELNLDDGAQAETQDLESPKPSLDVDDSMDIHADLVADESETKIDLARAYVEMEDFEGARELLKEVLQEGTEEQKKLVEQILADIS